MRQKINIRRKLSDLVKSSVILYALRVASTWLYFNLAHGVFGRFFTSYDKAEELLEDSVTGLGICSTPGKRTLRRRLRRRIALTFEKSRLLSWLGCVPGYLLSMNVRAYGTCGISFGLYAVIISLLTSVIKDERTDFSTLALGGVIMAVSLVLMTSKISLAQALRESYVSRLIIIRFLRVHEDKLYPRNIAVVPRYSVALVVGMMLGVLTIFVGIKDMLLIAALIILVWAVLSLPEVGIMGLIACAPFLSVFPSPSTLLAMGVLLVTVSYLIKFFRGKRTMRLGLLGAVVSLFSVVVLFGGIVTVGGVGSLSAAVMYCLLLQCFNLIINLFRTRSDCLHAIRLLAVSGAVVALYGVAQYLLGNAAVDWIDTEMFFFIEGRATAFFDNPNVLGAYIIIVLPMMVVVSMYSRGVRAKLMSVLAVAVTMVCLVWTWSRGAWLGAIVGLLALFLIFSYKTIQVLLAMGLCLPFADLVLPHGVIDRFLSIGNMGDSSTFYRVFTWRGVSDMLGRVWASGVGVGTAAFEQVYPLFAHVGTEATPHAHNLFMQVTAELGVGGIVTFIAVLVLYSQACFTAIKKTAGKERMSVAAGYCGIVSALVMGLVDNVWYNYRVFFVFWSVMALTIAYINAITSERRDGHEMASPEAANINLNIIN